MVVLFLIIVSPLIQLVFEAIVQQSVSGQIIILRCFKPATQSFCKIGWDIIQRIHITLSTYGLARLIILMVYCHRFTKISLLRQMRSNYHKLSTLSSVTSHFFCICYICFNRYSFLLHFKTLESCIQRRVFSYLLGLINVNILLVF